MALKIESYNDGFALSVAPALRPQNLIVMSFQALGILVFCGSLMTSFARENKFAVGLFSIVLTFFWTNIWFARDSLRITPSLLRHGRSLFGFVFSEDEYTNTDIQNLRYDEWSEGRGGTQCAVRFEYHGLTVTVARQAGPLYSRALIDHLREIYPFPEPSLPE